MSTKNGTEVEAMNRRSFLGAAAAAISASALMAPAALAQTRAEIHKGEVDNSQSNPGPVNKPLQAQNAAFEHEGLRADIGQRSVTTQPASKLTY